MKILKNLTTSVLAIIFSVMISPAAVTAAEGAKPKQVLFNNVNVFNGTDDKLYQGLNVLVEDNLIKAISETSIKTKAG